MKNNLTTEKETETFIDFFTTPLYDLSMLEEMGDNGYIVLILEIFLKDTPVDLKEMKQALETGQIETVYKQAHKIKGSAGVIQAEGLVSLLERIERVSRTNTIDVELYSLVKDVQELYLRIEEGFKKHIKSLS